MAPLKTWDKFKGECNPHENSQFQWAQLKNEKHFTKQFINRNYENAANLITHDYHVIKGSKVITFDKSTPTKM